MNLETVIGVARLGMLAVVLCALLLSGCAVQPKSDASVEYEITEMLPAAVITSIETKEGFKSYEARIYHVENNGVEFVFQQIPRSSDPLFGPGIVYAPSNDYCERLFDAFSSELADIAQTYGVEIEAGSSMLLLTNHLASMEEIENGLNAMQAVYELLYDYIPCQNFPWFSFDIYLNTEYAPKRRLQTTLKNTEDWDPQYERELLYLSFKDCVKQGEVENVELSDALLDSIPTMRLDALYINGEQFHSEWHHTKFIYSLDDQQYYTIVGFGIKYTNGEEDHIQREIIEQYYPSADYTIDEKESTSSYRIGGDQYHVSLKGDTLIFKRNGEKLEINAYKEISRVITGDSYYYWISVDDFADIMGMTVDKVDETGVYLRMQADPIKYLN